jgi:hypothetical protein
MRVVGDVELDASGTAIRSMGPDAAEERVASLETDSRIACRGGAARSAGRGGGGGSGRRSSGSGSRCDGSADDAASLPAALAPPPGRNSQRPICPPCLHPTGLA